MGARQGRRILRFIALLWGTALVVAPAGDGEADGFSLRFFGNGLGDIDRVKIPIDDPTTVAPGPPADVGATDFTLEFWMKAGAAENTAGAVTCGDNLNWIFGNIVFDRDRFSQDRKFGLSIAGGRLVFGVSGDGTGDHTICGTSSVLDGQWHHVAVQRRRADGRMWLFVDGILEAQADGPDGDVSYPDDGVPGDFCGGPCTNSDPFLVIGAEKHDAGSAFPSYSGWIDEVRLSNVLRYAGSFARPSGPLAPDVNTVALYHLDEGSGDTVADSSGAPGGPSHGVRRFGGSPAGPVWSTDTPPFGGPLPFTGGVYVAAGDVNGDGHADIVTGPGPGGGPHVRVLSGASPAVELASFFAYAPAFTGGVRVAAGDVNGDGQADIFTAAGPGGGPHIRVFSGANPAVELAGFFAYAPAFTGGVFVAAGNLAGDGRAEIVTGADAGGGPHIRGFTGSGADAGVSFFAYAASFTGGVRVAAGNLDAAGLDEVVTGPGAGGGPHVRSFTAAGDPRAASFFAY